MSKTITVVLNGYKRQNLREQVNAIKKQSVPVKEIFYWQNTVPGFNYDEETYCELNSALSNYNYGKDFEYDEAIMTGNGFKGKLRGMLISIPLIFLAAKIVILSKSHPCLNRLIFVVPYTLL